MTTALFVDRIPGILATVDLVALVERYTGQPSRRDGTRLRWPCPHPDHVDADPSFVLYPRRQPPDFYCYGCGWGGDAISFLTGVEGLSRAEAIERLAGSSIDPCRTPQPPMAQPHPNRKKVARHDTPYTTDELEAFVTACHRALHHDAALEILLDAFPDAEVVSTQATSPAWAYLRQRGITPDEVSRHRIGYGVAGHPRFHNLRGRLTLPCPHGIEARLIPGHIRDVWQPQQRYVVPPGDPKRPWGIDRANPACGPLVLVEGVLDAITLERAGVQAIALRCKRLRLDDAIAIRQAGFRSVYLGLDATLDVTANVIEALIRILAGAGVGVRVVHGPEVGDWADLLTLPVEELAVAVAAGMVTA